MVKLCAKGMGLEAKADAAGALALYTQAWEQASTDLEKLTAAHYMARQQATIEHKLKWDETALGFALRINDEAVRQTYPSLYLNIGKCYEDLGDLPCAKKHYELALSFADLLPPEGYGEMIRSGIRNGIRRVS